MNVVLQLGTITALLATSVHGWWWTNKDCKVSGWKPYTECSHKCGYGTMTRKRSISQYQSGNGQPCPNMKEVAPCYLRPCPIDCQWGEWSQWSQCVACSGGTRSKFREVLTPAFYGGKSCDGSDVVVDYFCELDEPCNVRNIPCDTRVNFLCIESNECIPKYLRCNGDHDCAGGSDERHCHNSTTPACGEENIPPIKNVDIMGAGYDITKDKVVGQVLDNTKYHGQCNLIYNGDFGTRFRRPFNIQMYRGQVRADTVFHTHSYANAISLTESKIRQTTSKISGGVSVKFPSLFELSGKVARSEEHNWKTVIHKSSKDDFKYFKLESKVQVGHFKLKSHNLHTTHHFRSRVAKLSRTYDYAQYRQFINEFGTHYYTAGILGGEFDVVLYYRRQDLESSKLTDEQQRHCLTVESSYSFFGVKPNSRTEYCRNNTLSRKHTNKFIAAAVESIGFVRGGTSKTAAVLTFMNENATRDKYEQWTDSVKHNPALIDFEMSLISTLINDDTIRSNLNRALFELFDKYNPGICSRGQCRNGGQFVVTDRGGTCKCLCDSGFYNVACMSPRRNPMYRSSFR